MRKVLLLGFAFLFLASFKSNGQNEKFKALYMYNFTKYIEWPESYRQGEFIITVVGESPIINELKVISQKRKVGFQSIVIKKVTNPSEIGKCHIIFVPEQKGNLISDVIAKTSGINAVIITDSPGLIDHGAGINYVVSSGKQLFEISKTNLEKSQVKVGSDLLSLGIVK